MLHVQYMHRNKLTFYPKNYNYNHNKLQVRTSSSRQTTNAGAMTCRFVCGSKLINFSTITCSPS